MYQGMGFGAGGAGRTGAVGVVATAGGTAGEFVPAATGATGATCATGATDCGLVALGVTAASVAIRKHVSPCRVLPSGQLTVAGAASASSPMRNGTAQRLFSVPSRWALAHASASPSVLSTSI